MLAARFRSFSVALLVLTARSTAGSALAATSFDFVVIGASGLVSAPTENRFTMIEITASLLPDWGR